MTDDTATTELSSKESWQQDNQQSAPATASATADQPAFSFRTLKLHPGMYLQTQLLFGNAPKSEAQFMAAIHGKCVMLIPRSESGTKSNMRAGEEYIVSGFTGQYDFSFISQVIQVVETSLTHVVVSYPNTINAKMVRRAIRIKTSLPALAIQKNNKSHANVTVIDLSMAGAMLASPIAMGSVGDILHLKLSVSVDNKTAHLALNAAICHSRPFDNSEGYRIGLSFQALDEDDKLILHYLTSSATADEEIMLAGSH